jgi:DNA polymerase-3 subunit delta'
MKIIGHNKQVDMMARAVKSGRVHSSYLFYGQPGIGKKRVALHLAQMLNCTAGMPDTPCGECAACRRIANNTHPDVVTVSVLEDKSWISIEQIRDMIAGLQYRALGGGYNVRIIDDANLIKEDAANSLLKILEEPPACSVIILVTPVPRSLPRTILSRCVPVSFGIFSDSEIEQGLAGYRLQRGDMELITAMAMGSLGKAITLAENPDTLAGCRNMLEDFIDGSVPSARQDRKEAVEFLDILASRVRKKDITKLEYVLNTRNYVKRNANVGLALDVLRLRLKE